MAVKADAGPDNWIVSGVMVKPEPEVSGGVKQHEEVVMEPEVASALITGIAVLVGAAVGGVIAGKSASRTAELTLGANERRWRKEQRLKYLEQKKTQQEALLTQVSKLIQGVDVTLAAGKLSLDKVEELMSIWPPNVFMLPSNILQLFDRYMRAVLALLSDSVTTTQVDELSETQLRHAPNMAITAELEAIDKEIESLFS